MMNNGCEQNIEISFSLRAVRLCVEAFVFVALVNGL